MNMYINYNKVLKKKEDKKTPERKHWATLILFQCLFL